MKSFRFNWKHKSQNQIHSLQTLKSRVDIFHGAE